jgi:hypothetical protein
MFSYTGKTDMQTRTVDRSILIGIAFTLAACGIGLIGLPLIVSQFAFGSASSWWWLILAVATCLCLVAPAAALGRGLERMLARARAHGDQRALAHRARVQVARLLLAVGYVVLVQAIVRRPLVATVGESAEPFVIEASFAAVVLVALVLLLSWVHHTARPLVEGLARSTLDALLATSGSEAAAARAEAATTARVASAPTVLRAVEETLPAAANGHRTLAATRTAPRRNNA